MNARRFALKFISGMSHHENRRYASCVHHKAITPMAATTATGAVRLTQTLPKG